jgi:CPA2 family monovalent cation:H+ antiporter-2
VDSWHLLADIVILLGVALAAGLVFEQLRLGAMLGYLIAGVLTGPFIAADNIALASEIGVALLLFTIGLETSWSRLKSLGAAAAGGGTVQIILTTGVVMLACALVTNLSWTTALVLGFIVSMSSTATVLRALQERAEQESLHGRAALGILLLQDAAVVPLVLITSMLGSGGSAFELAEGLTFATLKALGLVLILTFIGGRLLPRLLGTSLLFRNRELPILLVVCACLGSTIGAHYAGLSPALGAFVAGMILADSPLAAQMRSDIGPLRAVLVTLFFVSVGMQADLGWLMMPLNLAGVSVLVGTVLVVKALLVMLVLRLFGAWRSTAVAAGLCIAQIGEFSFVLAGVARTSGLFDEELFRAVASTSLVTLLLTPLLVGVSRRAGAALGTGEPAPPQDAVPPEPHVLLIGYGPAGREVTSQLEETGLPVTVLDTNPHGAQLARGAGLRSFVGDAASHEVLEHVGVHSALVTVISIPDHVAAAQIMTELRAIRPGMPVIARARYHAHADRLRVGEQDTVVDEEEAVGRLMGFEAFLAAVEARPPDPAPASTDDPPSRSPESVGDVAPSERGVADRERSEPDASRPPT